MNAAQVNASSYDEICLICGTGVSVMCPSVYSLVPHPGCGPHGLTSVSHTCTRCLIKLELYAIV